MTFMMYMFSKEINFIFLRAMEVWTQWDMCKVSEGRRVNFARDPLRSYVHDPQNQRLMGHNAHLNVQLYSEGYPI